MFRFMSRCCYRSIGCYRRSDVLDMLLMDFDMAMMGPDGDPMMEMMLMDEMMSAELI